MNIIGQSSNYKQKIDTKIRKPFAYDYQTVDDGQEEAQEEAQEEVQNIFGKKGKNISKNKKSAKVQRA